MTEYEKVFTKRIDRKRAIPRINGARDCRADKRSASASHTRLAHDSLVPDGRIEPAPKADSALADEYLRSGCAARL